MSEPSPPPAAPQPPRKRLVPCPACRAPAAFSPDNPYRPFCSARCQGHDFGAWANEAYRVGASPPPDDQE